MFRNQTKAIHFLVASNNANACSAGQTIFVRSAFPMFHAQELKGACDMRVTCRNSEHASLQEH